MTCPPYKPSHRPSSIPRILLWLLLALVLGALAIVVDGCGIKPVIFHAPTIGRPLPVPHIKLGRR